MVDAYGCEEPTHKEERVDSILCGADERKREALREALHSAKFIEIIGNIYIFLEM